MCLKYLTDILSEVATWCNHDPTPDPDIYIQTSDVLFNTTDNPTKVYLYNPSNKSSTLLLISDVVTSSADIAHTSNKLWLYSLQSVSPYTQKISEWDITLSPFTAVYNRDITNIKYSAGLGAINDTLLIGHEWLLPVSKFHEADITNNIAVRTFKFDDIDSRPITGDYILTTTNKLIALETDTTPNPDVSYITQYNYLTGAMEFNIDISAVFTGTTQPFGLFEYDDEIYIAGRAGISPNYTGVIYKIDKTAPYSLILYDTTDYGINGASQVPEQLTVHFT